MYYSYFFSFLFIPVSFLVCCLITYYRLIRRVRVAKEGWMANGMAFYLARFENHGHIGWMEHS